MRNGKSTDLGLGAYPDVSLAEARIKADAARALLRDLQDPLAARKKSKADRLAARERTFRAAAEQLIADKGPGWRSPKHRAQWSSTLEAYAYPVFGDWPVQQVDSDAVMRVLRPLWERVPRPLPASAGASRRSWTPPEPRDGSPARTRHGGGATSPPGCLRSAR